MSDFATAVGQTFPWHELYVGDSAQAATFYSQALDWGTESMDMGEMGVYPMLKANGQNIAGIMGTSGQAGMEDVPPHWAIYISVDDVDARLAKCVELGASSVVGPMDIPSVGRMALLRDPQGAHFWIFKPSPQG